MNLRAVARAAAVASIIADLCGGMALIPMSFFQLALINDFKPWNLCGALQLALVIGVGVASEFLFIGVPIGIALAIPFHMLTEKRRQGPATYALLGVVTALISVKLAPAFLFFEPLNLRFTSREVVGLFAGVLGGLLFWRKTGQALQVKRT